jgi:predicted alpha/beta superfamily hydrolase
MHSGLRLIASAAVLCVAAACAPQAQTSQPTAASAPSPAPAKPTVAPAPVTLTDTESWELIAEGTGRTYPIWISLPASYADGGARQYPVVFVTDALYSFPLVRSIRNLVGQKGRNIEDFILVGLPPQKGLTSLQSRSRDYTPSNPLLKPHTNTKVLSAELYGEAATYRDFIERQVFPLIAKNYRADMQRKVFAGHSLGGLFGSFVLLTKPTMFQRYILSSPSLWFDKREILRYERAWAAANRDLPAKVMLYAGSFEAMKPAPRYFKTVDMLRDAQDFERLLESHRYPGLQIDHAVVPDEDHLTVYPGTISRGLLWALPGQGPYTNG